PAHAPAVHVQPATFLLVPSSSAAAAQWRNGGGAGSRWPWPPLYGLLACIRRRRRRRLRDELDRPEHTRIVMAGLEARPVNLEQAEGRVLGARWVRRVERDVHRPQSIVCRRGDSLTGRVQEDGPTDIQPERLAGSSPPRLIDH